MGMKQRVWRTLGVAILLSMASACSALPGGDAASALEASGLIETVEVAVAPELGGRVAAVLADRGQVVAAGDPLLQLDDAALAAQLRQAETALAAAQAEADMAGTALAGAEAGLSAAEAAVESARAAVAVASAGVDTATSQVQLAAAGVAQAETALQIAVAAARQQARPDRVAGWSAPLPDDFSTPPWYFRTPEELAAAEAEVAAARAAMEAEQQRLESLLADPGYRELAAATTRLADSQAAFLVADALLEREVAGVEQAPLQDFVQEQHDAAAAELAAAQLAVNQMLGDQAATDLLEARARLAGATERFEMARDRRDALQIGEAALPVQAAREALRQAEAQRSVAEAGVAQAEAGVAQAESGVQLAERSRDQAEAGVDQARAGVRRGEAAVAQAEAAFSLLALQREKLTVRAAVAGTVLTRLVEPGEVVAPGQTVLTVGRLADLTVTVYLPEDRYGQIGLGDEATLTVDSYPSDNFRAVVTRIADEAEFTPRNVQTQEERQTTVYAVTLAVEAPAGRLKPGMPADVRFTP